MFDGLNPPYATIVADPPWSYPEGFPTQSRTPGKWIGDVTHAPLPYSGMDLAAIKAMPVADLAAKDCRLFLWTTNRYLPNAFDVMACWGFRYKQALVWHKRDGNMGGSVAPNSAEFLLVGVKGSPPVVAKAAASVITTAAPKQHSRKPDAFLDLVEQVSPGPYLELFCRRPRFGWDTWGKGYEVGEARRAPGPGRRRPVRVRGESAVRVEEGRAIRFGLDEWGRLSGPERRAFDRWLTRLTGRHPSEPPRVRSIVYFGAGRYRVEFEVVESPEIRALRGGLRFEEFDVVAELDPILVDRWESVTVEGQA